LASEAVDDDPATGRALPQSERSHESTRPEEREEVESYNEENLIGEVDRKPGRSIDRPRNVQQDNLEGARQQRDRSRIQAQRDGLVCIRLRRSKEGMKTGWVPIQRIFEVLG
jgi:hypothetical protein